MQTIRVDKELLDRICEDLIPVIIRYREAAERNNELMSGDMTKGFEIIAQRIEEKRKLYTELSANIAADDFWETIIRSKIEMIAAIGGTNLMEEVYYHLEEHELNERYSLAGTFSFMAHGIAGWAH